MSSKSVLGDDPFAGDSKAPGRGATAAPESPGQGDRPGAEGAPGAAPGAQPPAEEPPEDRPGARVPPRTDAPRARRRTEKPPKPAAGPVGSGADPGRPERPGQQPPRPPRAAGGRLLEDGAAARRAARATASSATFLRPGPSAGAAEPPRPSPLRTLQVRPVSVLERASRGTTRWIAERRMRDRSDYVDEFGLDPVFVERWRPLLEFLFRTYWRVETSGIENIPDHDSAMIVANHAGTFPYDGAMIMTAVKYDHPAHRDVRPLVEDFIFHFPFIGVALNRIGCVRACPENAERLLRHGGLVAVFPEGVKGIGKLYSQRYQLQRFGRGGFVKLALQTRTPIVPAAVIGAEEIHPMLGRITWLAKYLGIPYVPLTPTFPWLGLLGTIPLPTKWQIRFGEPIDLAGQHGPAAAQDRVLVHRLAEQVRSTIQAMVDDALLSRRSVLFG